MGERGCKVLPVGAVWLAAAQTPVVILSTISVEFGGHFCVYIRMDF